MTLFELINDFRNFSVEKKNNFKVPLTLGGYIWRYRCNVCVVRIWSNRLWFMASFSWFCYIFGLPTIFQKSVLQSLFNSLIVFLIPVALYFFSMKIQIFRKSLVRNELNILTEKVNDYHKKTEITRLKFSTMLKIHTEVFNYDGLNYGEINTNDAIVYMGKNGFVCVVPVTKRLPMSMTRVYRFIWTSKEPSWRYDFDIWVFDVKLK